LGTVRTEKFIYTFVRYSLKRKKSHRFVNSHTQPGRCLFSFPYCTHPAFIDR
jgi:hypothetical protein